MKYIYNYKFEKKDPRDLMFKCQFKKPLYLPHNFSLVSPLFPAVLDQGDLGSCTSQATSNALRFCLRKEKQSDFQPSRLFIYYHTRLLENTVNQDSGAYIRDVMKAVKQFGVCPSSDWPYVIEKFTTPPPQKCKDIAKSHRNFKYLAVEQNKTEIKAALVNGFPVVCGIMVYTSLESEEAMKTGHIPMPGKEEQLMGGHCVLLVGYNDDTREFTFQNSWGSGVGDNGYFYIPYDFITNPNLANDFWSITYFD